MAKNSEALRHPYLVPMIVACALFMENLDSAAVATVLPVMAKQFNVGPALMSTVITAYTISLTAFIPLSGWVADRFGARDVFRFAIIIFIVTSLFSGLSETPTQLIIARTLQGIGGAMMVPVGRVVVVRAVNREDLVAAMAYLSVPALLGPVLGAPLGGMFATFFSWRWIFFINIPIGIFGFIMVTYYIKNKPVENVGNFDFGGWLVLAIGLTSFVSGLQMFLYNIFPGWFLFVIILFGLTVIIFYFSREYKKENQIIDVRFLRVATFRASIIGGTFFRIGYGGSLFIMPILLQNRLEMSVLLSGFVSFCFAAGALVMKATAVPVLRRFGFRSVLIWNALITALLFSTYGLFSQGTNIIVLLLLFILGGFFRSLQFAGINSLFVADIKHEDVARATIFSATMQQVSFSIGVAGSAIMLHHFIITSEQSILRHIDFFWVFIVLAASMATSALYFLPLSRDSGRSVAGARPLPTVR